jgi:hypothetical protein
LRGSTSKDHGGTLGVLAISEHIESLISDLDFLEFSASSQNIISEAMDGSLQNGSGGFSNSLEIIFLNSTGAENISVSKVLSGKITNW